MYFGYLITPFVAWFCAGILKFLVNSITQRRVAFSLIGYGGMPSNHSTIVSSMAALIALKEGLRSPSFGVALTLAFIVLLDAGSLRQHIASHAQALNLLLASREETKPLRERLGHKPIEIMAGVLLGIGVAWALHFILS